jgi:hypothetical protein
VAIFALLAGIGLLLWLGANWLVDALTGPPRL